jgi:16S rRNA (cytosine967-C5)-methyltransferase
MKFNNQLRHAVRLLTTYKGEIPFHSWLKSFFRQNPQMGSRDRKQLSEMAYSFFRMGHSLKNIPIEERILTGLFLSNQVKEPILEILRPEWHAQIEKPLEEKLDIIRLSFPDFEPLDIFPWGNLLSRGISHHRFCLSFLEKPRLFIRSRPGQDSIVTAKLQNHNIEFRDADPKNRLPFKAYSFVNGTKLDEILTLNKDAVVQDLSSQETALCLKPSEKKEREAWDCCAGSGGKSILLTDLYPECRLTVSDIRESILKNCVVRFKEAGIQPAQLFKADLTDLNDLPRQSYNFIVADLPCTGSGTWSRNPESLFYFKPESITNYSQRQEKILTNLINRLKPDGILVYITCSVFADENERISSLISNSDIIKLERQELITGYGQSADSMFVSRFIKLR